MIHCSSPVIPQRQPSAVLAISRLLRTTPSPQIDPVSEDSPSPTVTSSGTSVSSSSLDHTDCVVCGDKSSGKHYGQFSCEGCKSFFKRSIRRSLSYSCRGNKSCPVDIHHRNQCQYCRLRKCVRMGMRKEAVQRGRVPPPPPQLAFPSFFPMFRPIHTFSLAPPLITALTQTGLLHTVKPSDSVSMDYIPELAAQLLFAMIEWARQLPFVSEIAEEDQATLLKGSWSQLFLLYAAQSALPPQTAFLIASNRQRDCSEKEGSSIANHAQMFQGQLDLIRSLQLDVAEMNCVKAAVLFNPDTSNLSDRGKIELIQEKIQSSLDDYCRMHKSQLSGRFGRILLRLPSLRSLNPASTELLFFHQLVGRMAPVVADLWRQRQAAPIWPYPLMPPVMTLFS